MEELLVITVIGIYALIVIYSSHLERNKEFYYLKNFKFQLDNPEVRICSKHHRGDYFIAYEKDGVTTYQFFMVKRARREQHIKHLENNLECTLGTRPSELPEKKGW